MVEQADKARIDRARGTLRTALVEMAKAGGARHGEGSGAEAKAAGTTGRGTKGGQSAPSGQ